MESDSVRLAVAVLSMALCGCVTLASQTASGAPPAPMPGDEGSCGNLTNVVNVLWVDGEISSWPGRCDAEASRGRAAVRELASRELACASDALLVSTSPLDDVVITAEGCGRHAAYFYYTAGYGSSRLVPGYEGRAVNSQTHLLTRLTPDRIATALAGVSAFIARIETQPNAPSADRLLGLDVQLLRAASRDLQCPVDEIVPAFVYVSAGARVPVAEGCGHRATYLPTNYTTPIFVLSALLPLGRSQ